MPSKIIIIGIDGATMNLIRPWVSEGKLSGFKYIIEHGVSGGLMSSIPPCYSTCMDIIYDW